MIATGTPSSGRNRPSLFGVTRLGLLGLLARTIEERRRQRVDLGIDLFTACNQRVHEFNRRHLLGLELLTASVAVMKHRFSSYEAILLSLLINSCSQNHFPEWSAAYHPKW